MSLRSVYAQPEIFQLGTDGQLFIPYEDLAQRLFLADQGMFRSGDYYQMMNRSSCLSLLSNAVLVYNTLRIGQVLERAKARGQAFSAEAIAHVSPLAHRHVIVNGTYNFSPAQGAFANNGLCV